MRIGFVVNEVATEHPLYTTTRLAFAAARRQHEVWTMGVGDLAQEVDGTVTGVASRPDDKRYRSLTSFASDLFGGSRREKITLDELDVLMLRNDPSEDAVDRPWAQTSGVLFGELAARRGVIVLNDPVHLAERSTRPTFSTSRSRSARRR